MLKQGNIRFFVLFVVFTGCCHRGMLVYAEGDELFTENSSCPWSEEGCAENVKKDDLPENAISELSENTESRSNNWPEQFQVFDGMLEDKVNRGEGDQGAISVPHPIAIYPLNSKYETQEINNRQPQGTPVGVSLAAGPDGKPGGSYQFQGQANSYIEFPNNGGLDAKRSITMLCWIFPQSEDGQIFSYGARGLWGVHMVMVSGKLFVRFKHRNYQSTPNLTTNQSLARSQWHYVGSSYDHNTGIASLWLNGQHVMQQDIGAGMTLATQDNVRMGAREDYNKYFNGRITAMQVYNVSLTREQINAVRNAGRDIDECDVSNGGCSHKCINTAGGYKCECPDPELSLALDNKTCHAPGVDVQCNRDNMTIIITKSLLRGIDREHLRLLDTTCNAEETSAHFSLTTSLSGCNTTRRHTPTAIVYSNTVLEIPVAAKDVVTRVREIEIQFSCFYSKYGVVSSVGWKPSNRKLVFSDEGKGNFTLSLNMFPDKRFVSPYTKDDFPVAVVLRKLLFFEVSVTSSDKLLSIIADRCYATPNQNRKNSLNYEFIRKGCPNDVTVKYHTAPSFGSQRFSVEAFKYIADHPFVFIHCHVIVCNATDPGSQCEKKCPLSGRRRRGISDHVPNMYSLAQGPLHLAREKREEKNGKGLDTSGSRPIFLMALFLMCVASLAGTALLLFKKTRVKPVGYAVLVSGDEE